MCSSLVISRHNEEMGGRETFVPSRLLRGVIPSALLEAYQFWRGEGGDLVLRGEPKDPKSQWFGQHIQINLERAPGRAGAGGSDGSGGASAGGGGGGDRGDHVSAKGGKAGKEKGGESKAVDSGGGGGGSGGSEVGGGSGDGVASPLQELLGGAAVWSWQGDLSYAVIRRKPKGVKPKPITRGDHSAYDHGGDGGGAGGGGGGGGGGETEERKEGDKKTEGATGEGKKPQGVVGPGGHQLLRVDSRAGQDRYVQMGERGRERERARGGEGERERQREKYREQDV